jgi:hypothetical protein
LPPEAAAPRGLRYAGLARFTPNHDSEQAMLRFTIAILVAMIASDTAMGAEKPLAHHVRHQVARLPAGLPRPHYDFRTTIAGRAPALSRRSYAPRQDVNDTPDVLFTPDDAESGPRRTGTPLLPGSSTLPGYYGSPDSYDYQGPYYGGPDFGYWDRLPYACGVYGYC